MRHEKERSYYQEQRQPDRLVVTIDGRPVDSIAVDHPQVEQIQNTKSNANNPNNAVFYAATPKAECSVLVKGLPPTLTNANIRAHFAPECDPVPRVSILKRPISGHNSNLAWVCLNSEHAASMALTLSGSTMLRQTIEVWPKESEEAKREVQQMNIEKMKMSSYSMPPFDPYSMFGFVWEY